MEADIDIARLKALSKAQTISLIYRPEYFPDASKAVRAKDAQLWRATCKKAGIPDEQAAYAWSLIEAAGAIMLNMW
jgi:hypothetical protein